MMMILTERGHSFTTTAVRVIVRDAEVQLAYSRWTSTASCRPQRGAGQGADSRAPGRQHLIVSSEHFRCPEVLFNPTWSSRPTAGARGRVFETNRERMAHIMFDTLNMPYVHGVIQARPTTCCPLVPARGAGGMLA